MRGAPSVVLDGSAGSVECLPVEAESVAAEDPPAEQGRLPRKGLPEGEGSSSRLLGEEVREAYAEWEPSSGAFTNSDRSVWDTSGWLLLSHEQL